MLNFVLPLFRLRTLVVLLGLAALAALIWYGGPYANAFGYGPLSSTQARMLTIAGLFGLVILVALFRYWRARRANAQMIRKLLDSDGLVSLTETQSQDEVAILRERFESAMAILTKRQVRTPSGNGFLLDLPWYVIIGPPGSGKTTILRNSGLEFPLADRVGADVLAGVGGTRNCDWWFTDQAVLLDTAGRYTTQDSNAVVDRAAWRGFLDLLKEFRRRRPLNGVLLALSLGDILSQDGASRTSQIEIFRQRLQELMRAFGLRLPVYLLITKCDLIAGFSEYFDDLSDLDREQLWGMTFTPQQADTGLTAAFNAGFTDLLGRLLDRLPERLHAERDTARRRQVFAFPQQFGGIRDLVSTFVNDVFRPNRYDLASMLRGVFFTSGTQEGTPIDRLMGAYARAFGLATSQTPLSATKARTFFVHQMLSDVVFAESGLVGTDRALERRLAITHAAGYAATAAVLVGVSLLWLSAYHRGSTEARSLTDLGVGLQQLRSHAVVASLDDTLVILDRGRSIAHFFDDQGFLDGWVTRLGMSSAGRLSSQVELLYQRLLTGDLLPAMTNRMQAQVLDAMGHDASNPTLHQMLAQYLMLSQTERFSRLDFATWMAGDSQSAYPLDQARRQDLAQHYRALLALLPIRQPIDPSLVETVRARLIRIPQAEAIYASLRADADRNRRLPAFTFANVLGPAADTAFADPAATGMRAVIPGFFTHDGFYDGFVARLPGIVRDQVQSDWVLGQDASGPSVATAEDLIRQVSALYVRDYVTAWQNATTNIGMTHWASFDGLQNVLQTLIGPNQPLSRIADAVRTNTDLPRQRDSATPPPTTAPAPPPPTLVSTLTNALSTTPQAASVGLLFPEPWPGDEIGRPFAPILGLTQSQPGQTNPIGVITDQIGAVYAVISQIASTDDPAAAALRYQSAQQRNQANDAAGILRVSAATRPEPFRGIMLQVANSVAGTIMGGARAQMSTLYRSEVLPGCQAVVGNRYPFVRNAIDEVSLKDFTDFFKPGGAEDTFAKGIEAQSPDAPVIGVRSGPNLFPTLKAQFAAAARIREAFFGNGADLLVRFSITPRSLDPGLASATIQIDDKTILYRHDPPRAIDLTWPTAIDASVARISLQNFRTQATMAEDKGPWALFRLFDAVGLTPTGRAGTYTFSVNRNDQKASFTLTANSAVNAFALADIRSFRCHDGR